MKLKYSFFILLFVLFQVNLAKAQTSFNKVDSLLTELEDNNIAIGSVSIFKEGKEVYNRSFGQKNIPNKISQKNNRYQIGSITKMVTATLIFKLIEDNKLSLDTKLEQFYPEIPNSDKITVKNLLEHSSGLGDYVSKDGDETWLTQRVSSQDIINEIIRQGVLFQPNEKTKYSNSAYYLLAGILDKLYKKDYNSIIIKEIIKPLRLKSFKSYLPKQNKIFRSFSFSDKWETVKEFDFSNVIGVGDITSTTHDMNLFINSLFKGKLLSKESLNIMKPDTTTKEVYGRGMYIMPFYNFSFYGHAGDTYGTHTTVGYNADLDLSYSIMLNASRYERNEIYIAILSNLFEKNYELPNYTIIKLFAEELDKYLGNYTNTEIPLEVFVFVENNVLKAQAKNQEAIILDCYEGNKFVNEANGLKIEFLPQENKLILLQGGERVEMNRIGE
ncbi:serine hydrolase domain-containing protein [Sphingobacterium composti Ten et al. 2007 non Yoo et al. 2007]|uniref:serine hydrolase domain-containing protein n=1 Tax=Sphingobacterium composti TaxID=363260 RepID=UPI001357A6E8|nr:serine hydrolase domain-containing protein [Sphingobacterium composti Ten et al. 2007 non Yoo et al. 2007]